MHKTHQGHVEVKHVNAKLVLLQLGREDQIVPACDAEDGNRNVPDQKPNKNHESGAELSRLFKHCLREDSRRSCWDVRNIVKEAYKSSRSNHI